MFCFDQTYEWVGMQKHGRRRTLERVDAAGMPIVIENEVYINSIKINLPETLGTLSAADRQRIAANHGSPYTEDYSNVLDVLEPSTVQAGLLELARDALCVRRGRTLSPAARAHAEPRGTRARMPRPHVPSHRARRHPVLQLCDELDASPAELMQR